MHQDRDLQIIEREYLIKERLAAIMGLLLSLSLIGVNTVLSQQDTSPIPLATVSLDK